MESRGVIGTVLSFDLAEGGLLRSEDGKRYSFGTADWHGKTGPVPGARVDFEPDGEQARALLPLPVPAATGAAAPSSSFLAGKPGLPIALLMLVACVFPFLTLGTFSANMFNIVSTASSLGDYAPLNVNMETGLWLFHFLYVVPAAALALVVGEWLGRAGRWWRIGTGLVGLLAPVAIALGARALFTPAAGDHHLSLGARVLRRVGEVVAPDLFVPHVGMGWIALAVLSLALVCVGIFAPAKARRAAA
jgi:hypothetical protein